MIRCYMFLILLFTCVLLIAGCFGRSAPAVTYYSLLTMEQLGEESPLYSLPEIKLGVGPVTIPDSLKRSQIVTRKHGNQYSFDEFHRWAGILEKDLNTVLGDNLSLLLGVEMVDTFPWRPYFHPTFQIVVDVSRLDGDLDDEAVLKASWMVSDVKGQTQLFTGKSVHRQKLDDSSYTALIRAESQLVAALSKDIAAELFAYKSR